MGVLVWLAVGNGLMDGYGCPPPAPPPPYWFADDDDEGWSKEGGWKLSILCDGCDGYYDRVKRVCVCMCVE